MAVRVGDRPLENGAKGFRVSTQKQTDKTKNQIGNLGNFKKLPKFFKLMEKKIQT